MTRLADLQAAALQLDRLPPDTAVCIGNDGAGPDPADIRCRVVLPDGRTVGSAIGGSWEDAARRVADALCCDPTPTLSAAAEREARLRSALIAVDSQILLDGGIKELVDEVLHETEQSELSRAALRARQPHPAASKGEEEQDG